MTNDFDPLEEARAAANASDAEPVKRQGLEKWRKAKEEYDDLLSTIEQEAQFLAKCYVVAKHIGRFEEYKTLLERAILVKPKKVFDAASTFGGLAVVYDEIVESADDVRRVLIDYHYWTGHTADGFNNYFRQVLGHMGSAPAIQSHPRSLSNLARMSKALLMAFGKALTRWRSSVADAIKKVAQYDRDMSARARDSWFDAATVDPLEAAIKSLKALLTMMEAADREAQQKDLLWFDQFKEAMNVEDAVPKDEDLVANYFASSESFDPHMLYVNVPEVAKFIGYVQGFAKAVDAIPDYLAGRYGKPSVWLTKRDLGNVDHFYASWIRLCEWRQKEAEDIGRVLWRTAERLTTALNDFTKTDQEIVPLFPRSGDSSLFDALKASGMDLDEPARREYHNIPEGAQ